MKYRFFLLGLVLLASTSCGKSAPVVILDGWWNIDFAKESCRVAKNWMKENQELVGQLGCDSVTSCKEMTAAFDACVTDGTGGAFDFQTDMATAFASDERCEGVRFVELNNPSEKNERASDALGQPHWVLTLSFSPGANKQPWKLLGPSSQLMQGNGTAQEIARTVCSIAGGRGAAVAN